MLILFTTKSRGFCRILQSTWFFRKLHKIKDLQSVTEASGAGPCKSNSRFVGRCDTDLPALTLNFSDS